ncbi:hypothetical protein VTO73DRAFT_13158 [Trametes versicolor]
MNYMRGKTLTMMLLYDQEFRPPSIRRVIYSKVSKLVQVRMDTTGVSPVAWQLCVRRPFPRERFRRSVLYKVVHNERPIPVRAKLRRLGRTPQDELSDANINAAFAIGFVAVPSFVLQALHCLRVCQPTDTLTVVDALKNSYSSSPSSLPILSPSPSPLYSRMCRPCGRCLRGARHSLRSAKFRSAEGSTKALPLRDVPAKGLSAEKHECLKRPVGVCDVLTSRQDLLEMGCPVSRILGEIHDMLNCTDYMLAIGESSLEDVTYPFLVTINSGLPALIVSNPVIIKMSLQTPLAAERFMSAFRDVLSIIYLSPELTSAAVKHPAARRLSIVHEHRGRRPRGRHCCHGVVRFQGCWPRGGKDPAYVRADENLDYTTGELVDGAMFSVIWPELLRGRGMYLPGASAAPYSECLIFLEPRFTAPKLACRPHRPRK